MTHLIHFLAHTEWRLLLRERKLYWSFSLVKLSSCMPTLWCDISYSHFNSYLIYQRSKFSISDFMRIILIIHFLNLKIKQPFSLIFWGLLFSRLLLLCLSFLSCSSIIPSVSTYQSSFFNILHSMLDRTTGLLLLASFGFYSFFSKKIISIVFLVVLNCDFFPYFFVYVS